MNERLIRSFMDFVRIDSESGNEEAFLSHLKQVLEREAGGKCVIDDYGNLLAQFEAKGCSSSQPIVLSSHADTVKPGSGIEPVMEDGRIRSRGDTVLGGDDKAAIAEILEALRSAPKRPSVEWIITRQEEVGLLGARNFDTSRLKGKMGFLLDGEEIESLIVGGPSHMKLDVEVTGRAAHAGMEPENGISAIQAAAYSISKMRLGRLDEESTANVGTINGGTVRNAVPEKAIIVAECRSLDHEKCLKQAEEMKALFQEGGRVFGARVEVKTTLSYRAMRIAENAKPVVIARRAMERCRLLPKIKRMTGGTDAQIFAEKGIELVVMGMAARKAHTVEEYVEISEMEKMVEVLKAIFADLCG